MSKTAQVLPSFISVPTRLIKTASQVTQAGIRYGLKQAPLPVLLREHFEALGATYIKLGQFIASTPTVFPEEYVTEFQKCFDKAPPVPFSYIKKQVESTLGQSLETLYASFDTTPIASASIAQVHAATLHTGEQVVVKVQKPGIDSVLKTDLTVVHATAKLVERFVPKVKMASLSSIAGEIKRRMLKETDFIAEAQNINEFRHMLAEFHISQVTAPKVYPELSNNVILTMERLYGVPFTHIDDMRKIRADIDQVLMMVMDTWFSSLNHCQHFHADLHAGNLLLLQDGRVGFIDFGIVGALKPEVWQAGIAFMQALQQMNFEAMAQNMLKMGMTSQQVSLPALTRDITQLFEQVNTSVNYATTDATQIAAVAEDAQALLMRVIKIGELHGVHFPADFALLFKQLMYFDRFMTVLAPDMPEISKLLH